VDVAIVFCGICLCFASLCSCAFKLNVCVFFVGTTGESLRVFTEALGGVDHKLLLVMNKIDTLKTTVDLARTFGTLCWNLSKVITTKDMVRKRKKHPKREERGKVKRRYGIEICEDRRSVDVEEEH
jgi:hypothetical protein